MTGLSALDLFAEARRSGSITAGTVRSALGIWGNPGFQETMRKIDVIGQAVSRVGTIPQMPKLPKGF